MDLPGLPEREHPWPSNIHAADGIIRNIYYAAIRILRSNDADPIRVAYHRDALSVEALPLLEAIESDSSRDDHLLLDDWLLACAGLLGEAVAMLEDVNRNNHVENVAQPNVIIPELVTEDHGHRCRAQAGRPRKHINLEFVREALSNQHNITMVELARLLRVSHTTLWQFVRQHGLQKHFTTISDADLDNLVKTFKERKPESGFRYLVGFLRHQGVRVQQRRVWLSLRRVDRLGSRLREQRVIRRRKYRVPRPNALWHMDGHHKLIRWGFVLHGIIDGYCRTITALRASTNNRASTVLELFMQAKDGYGMPSRVRGDRGGENLQVATYMVATNGHNRGSFLWGSSTRNSRIERLWVEVGTQFARRWRGFFTRLERLHRLDVDRSSHLWLLSVLFSNAINDDCQQFQLEWNSHPICGSDTNNRSPQDMRLLGQASLGIYEDEFSGIHPATMERYYGIHGGEVVRRRNQTGAGHPDDESNEDEGTILGRIEQDQANDVQHDAVEVPDGNTPFNNEEDEAIFFETLEEVVAEGIIPEGYNLLEGEDDYDESTTEYLRVGRRSEKYIEISLANPIWRTRSRLWAQAASVLCHFEAEGFFY